MFTLIFRTLLDRKNSIIMFVGTGVGLLWLYVLLFPFFQDVGADIFSLFESVEGLKDIIPLDPALFDSIENFLALEQYNLIVPLLVAILLMGISANGLAGDIEFGTVEIVLSRSLSRMKIFFSHYLAGIIALILFVAFTSLMIVPFGELHNLEYNLDNFIKISVLVLLFGWAVFSVAMMVSAMVSEKSRVSMIIGGGLIVMYVIQIASKSLDKIDFIKYLSFFYYYDYEAALLHNTISGTSITFFCIVAVVTTIVGAWWYNKRDIAV
ncbi:MAG: ABC transporter permease subunit [Candidatus Kerfeldbacteria bacterium]|jgi:ABC-type transport system involved in multi-copper enzyme maturation permease subunit